MIQKGLIFVNFHLILLLSLSCFVVDGHGKQTDKLQSLLTEKLQNRARFNTEPFYDQETEIFNEAQVYPQEGLKEEDKIEMLPGQPSINFDQYGGYVTVDKSAGRALYYYFAEAVNKKDTKPLLLWLNGGPGCSSIAYGAMEEHGPFRVYSDGKSLYRNPYAWNRVANVLYLESPAGVGFSYSNTTSDYANSGDRRTAMDNYVFLVNWLTRFPEFKTREFYISGESYAGHYVPQLAHLILQGNRIANRTIINLKGIIIGNAVINDETDQIGMYEYFWTHALISDETNYFIKKYCDFSPAATTESSLCLKGANEANTDINSINIYNIYAPLCFSNNVTVQPKKASVMNFDPCSDNYVYAYLNRPDVQKALHANVTKLDHDWEPCSDVINAWNDSPSTILPLLREAMNNGLRVWVFSGDIDARVPVTSTRSSLNKLELSVKKSWYPWFVKNEVGGYTFVYKGDITFATVRGSGHEVPSYQPERALTLIQYFLSGKRLPDGSSTS
ncbi:hypothetical protein NE237_003466 [Protea cynaroides]|uniref:Carboxypeptidase n=1 Tax=Protea cynaroides TaxID=273540 RepID=A0A9Q0KH14_9MAGN|nr:hypothetical protein NE237_003466 [Protea cynaroides]